MLIYAILFFFFFRLVTNFVEAIYAFGLLGTSLPPELAFVLLLFAPAVLLFARKPLSERGVTVLGGLVLAAGALELFPGTRGRMLVAGLGTGLFLVFLPALLASLAQRKSRSEAYLIGLGLALWLALFILSRAWNSGVDPSNTPAGKVAFLLLAALGAVPLLGELRRSKSAGEAPLGDMAGARPGFGRTAGLCLGIVSALTMLYFTFESPNVLARWAEASYPAVLAVTALSLSIFAFLLAAMRLGRVRLSPTVLLLWNLLFVLALVAAILPYQLRFPPGPAGYPFHEPGVSPLASLPLFAAILLFPVLLLDFTLYSLSLIESRATLRSLAGGFTLAALFLLVMIFAHVFTTVYDYIPVVGPLFRDRFWVVYLALGLAAGLPALLAKGTLSGGDAASARETGPMYVFAGLIAVLAFSALAGGLLTSARPTPPAATGTTLRILTFNIQQGYSEDGQKSHPAQLALMRQWDADVIGLQESDTNRIAGGNTDLVRYFADQLDYYAYYGPKVVPGTFGIALLSRYPIDNPRTFYMYSTGEQTAAIVAGITVGEKKVTLLVTHLGNGGPMVQQEAVLQEIAALPAPLAAMGDFNFRPDTEQYRLTTASL
ncbi:MAG: endonuclease/exonuclease/phosphatase family protein, partial [Chloroflexota bacterium]